jgi:PAS domain S-box-containing protein
VASNDDTKSVDRAFAVGAEEYITKPIKWALLRQRIRIYLERKKNLVSLQASEERFRSVTNSTMDAIISADKNGCIVFWNNGAENVFGYKASEIIGKPVIKLMPKRFRKDHLDGFKNLIKTGKSKFQGNTVELVGMRNDGTKFPLEISLTSCKIAEKKYISAVLRDITERKRVIGNREGIALFDTHIIRQIYSLWQQAGNRDAGQLSFQKLKIIMEMVFLAGIQNEEGEEVRLAVSLFESDNFPDKGPSSDHTVVRFEKPLPFSLDSLTKLAAGIDPETTVFAVSSSMEQPEELAIWAMIFTSSRGKTRLDPYPFVPEPLDVLTVSSTRSGSLAISWGGRVLANFNSGHFSEMSMEHDVACPVSQNLLMGVTDHKEFKKGKNAYWSIYQEVMRLLVSEATKRCHGATIVWLPQKQVTAVEKTILTKYPLLHESNVPQGIADLCGLERKRARQHIKDKKKNLVDVAVDGQVLEDTINECKKRLVDNIELLAQLTSVDGALILSHRLSPLSFGSVLTAPHWTGSVQYCQSGQFDRRQSVNMTKYGTRHTSAVNFVGRHPGVVVFVISQDGPISCLVRKDKETVYWLPDFLSSQDIDDGKS